MVKARTYGKKSSALSLTSYHLFIADSSGHETSPDVSVLQELSNNANIKPVPVEEIKSKVHQTTVSGTARLASQRTATSYKRQKRKKNIEAIRTAESHHSVNGRDQQYISDEIKLSPSSSEPRTIPSHICEQSPPRRSPRKPKSLHDKESPQKYSGRSLDSILPQRTTEGVDNQKRWPRKEQPAPTTTDDLDTLFTSLRLNSSPETSLLTPCQTREKIKTISKSLPARIASYLSPILGCKNVSPDVSDFQSWMSDRGHLMLEKVGEGSFGEVFRATSPDGKAVILKLMPLNAERGRGSKSFTPISSAANEIRLLERMQRVPGFVEFRGACILTGPLPKTFVDLWNEYKNSGRTVESRDPNKKASYSQDQLWLLLEMSDAGRNLEPGQYAPPGETATRGTRYLGLGRTWDIFWEVVKSVAKAEYWAHFEHRDLHLGNVCARDTTNTPDKEDLNFVPVSSTTPIPVNQSGLEITIIDYSLSRAFMDSEDDVLFYDLRNDKHLLKGEGDLQYDMYRYMAAAIGKQSPKEFVPQTNIVWLWYLLDRLMVITKELSPRARAKKRGFITREARIQDILNEVHNLTNPEYMEDWTIDSATALLGIGIERGWLSQESVSE